MRESRLDRIEGNLERVEGNLERVEGNLETLTRVVGHHQAQSSTILDSLAMLTESQRMLPERMDSLIRTFEEWIRRSGNGSRPN